MITDEVRDPVLHQLHLQQRFFFSMHVCLAVYALEMTKIYKDGK